MRTVTSAAVVVAAALLQMAAGDAVALLETPPSLPLLAAAWVALRRPRREALAAALVGGSILDLLSVGPLGAHAVSFALLAHVLSRAARAGWTERPVPLGIVLLGALPAAAAGRVLLTAAVEGVAPQWREEGLCLAGTLLLAGPAIATLDARLGRRPGPRPA